MYDLSVFLFSLFTNFLNESHLVRFIFAMGSLMIHTTVVSIGASNKYNVHNYILELLIIHMVYDVSFFSFYLIQLNFHEVLGLLHY
jgi:hypothetical protein